jgi:ATPase family associated with various cellular activities (AAA)
MPECDVEEMVAKARYGGPTVAANQVIGLDACLGQLEGQLALLARPELGARFGLEPSGTLFIGAPGTGKTLLARYLAGALERPLYQFSADQFEGQPGLIHAVFDRLGSDPAVVFIDEGSSAVMNPSRHLRCKARARRRGTSSWALASASAPSISSARITRRSACLPPRVGLSPLKPQGGPRAPRPSRRGTDSSGEASGLRRVMSGARDRCVWHSER